MTSPSLVFSPLFILLALFNTVDCFSDGTTLTGSGSGEAAPYIWLKSDKDELLAGAIPDLAQIIAGDIGIPIVIKNVGPWARAQQELKVGKIDLLWGALRTKEREEYAYFVPTPLIHVRSVVLSHLDDQWRFSKFSDLEGRRGVLTLGDSFGEEFDRYASERLKIFRVPRVENAVSMLLAKRVDYTILDESIARSYLASSGIDKIRLSETEVSGQDLFLLISKNSPRNTSALRDLLNRALLKQKEKKTIDSLLANDRG